MMVGLGLSMVCRFVWYSTGSCSMPCSSIAVDYFCDCLLCIVVFSVFCFGVQHILNDTIRWCLHNLTNLALLPLFNAISHGDKSSKRQVQSICD